MTTFSYYHSDIGLHFYRYTKLSTLVNYVLDSLILERRIACTYQTADYYP